MTRAYRHSNGRIQARGARGRFRQWTGEDVGIGVCPKCSTLTVRPELKGPFIDPLDFHARICGNCGWDSRKDSTEPKKDVQ